MKKMAKFIIGVLIFVGFSSIATASSCSPCEVKCAPQYKWVTKCKTVCKTDG